MGLKSKSDINRVKIQNVHIVSCWMRNSIFFSHSHQTKIKDNHIHKCLASHNRFFFSTICNRDYYNSTFIIFSWCVFCHITYHYYSASASGTIFHGFVGLVSGIHWFQMCWLYTMSIYTRGQQHFYYIQYTQISKLYNFAHLSAVDRGQRSFLPVTKSAALHKVEISN